MVREKKRANRKKKNKKIEVMDGFWLKLMVTIFLLVNTLCALERE